MNNEPTKKTLRTPRQTELTNLTACCPLCKSKPDYFSDWNLRKGPMVREIEYEFRAVGHEVVCLACDLRGPFGETGRGAIVKWNENAKMIAAGVATFSEPDKDRDEKSKISARIGFEFGHRCCEKGMNLQAAQIELENILAEKKSEAAEDMR